MSSQGKAITDERLAITVRVDKRVDMEERIDGPK